MSVTCMRMLLGAGLLGGCAHAVAHHEAHCPVGTVRLDAELFSGGSDLTDGFKRLETADGTAAYRREEEYGTAFACGFVCPRPAQPVFLADHMVCRIDHK